MGTVGIGALLFWWMYRPKYRKWNPFLRMLSLFFLHAGMSLCLFSDVDSVEQLPWESKNVRGWALIEVRDSFYQTKKSAGVVYCVGWKDQMGRAYDASFVLRCAFDGKDSLKRNHFPQTLRKYWVPTEIIHSYSEPEVPFDPNWRRIMRSLGIHGHLKWDSAVIYQEKAAIDDFLYPVYRWKNQLLNWIRGVLYAAIQQARAALVFAMLVGDKSDLDPAVEQWFGTGGLLHVLAVSGMHVSLIMGALLWILTGFGYRGRPTIKTLFLLLAAGWFYAFLSGGSASVIRAMIGASWVWLGKFAVHRKQKLTHVLCGSAYLQWISDPFIVEQLGFQLSYLAVLGIATLHSRWIILYEQPSTLINAILSSLSLTLSATLFTLPLILYQFGSFPTWFLLGNLFLLPLFTLMVYLSLICLLFVWLPVLSDGLFWMLDLLIHWVLQLLQLFELLPIPQIKTLSLGWISFLLLGLLVFFVDHYFKLILNLNEVSNDTLKKRISIQKWSILLVLLLFFTSHEIEQHLIQQKEYQFTVTYRKEACSIVKKQDTIRIYGGITGIKTRKAIINKLNHFVYQTGANQVIWINK